MTETKASWVTAKPQEIKEKIIELAKQGTSPEKIGLILRDQHGIPKARLLGIRIKHVLEEASSWKDPEIENKKIKIEKLGKHAEKHKHDYTAKRTLSKETANLGRKLKKSQY